MVACFFLFYIGHVEHQTAMGTRTILIHVRVLAKDSRKKIILSCKDYEERILLASLATSMSFRCRIERDSVKNQYLNATKSGQHKAQISINDF